MFSENRPLGYWWGGLYTPYVNSIGEPLQGPYWTMPYRWQPNSVLQIPAHNLKVDINALQPWARRGFAGEGEANGAVFQPFASWPGGGVYSLPLTGSGADWATWMKQTLYPPSRAFQVEVFFQSASRISATYVFYRYNLRVSRATQWYAWYGSKVEVEDPGPLGLYRLYTWPISKFTNPVIAGTWNALPVNGFQPVELTITEDV